jgi:hypothetical protein
MKARWAAVAGFVLVYAWWVVSLPPFSGSATAAVVLTGAAAAVWGWRRRPRRPASAPSVTAIVAWAVLAGAAGAWQLAAYLQHPRPDHPTLSSLANTLLGSQPARAAAFVLWVAGAVGLARR